MTRPQITKPDAKDAFDFYRCVVGADGWAFLGNIHQSELEQVTGRFRLPDENIEQWLKTLALMQRFAERHGAHLAFCVAPAKSTIYFDKLPTDIAAEKGQSVFDRFLNKAKRAEVPIIDVRPSLIAARATADTHSPLDSHWTAYGAAVAWNVIAAAINERRPEINLRHVVKIVGVETKLGPNELAEFVPGDGSNPCTVPVLENPLPDFVLRIRASETRQGGTRPVDLTEYPASAKSTAPASNFRGVLFSDSMGSALSPYMIASFQEVAFRRHHVTVDKLPFNLPGILREARPDVVLFELAERYLIQELPDIEQWEAAEKFDATSSDSALTCRTESGEVVGLVLNGDPSLSSPAYVSITDSVHGGNERYVRITVVGEQRGTLQLAYTLGGKAILKEAEYDLGLYEYYFSIPGRVTGEHFWLRSEPSHCKISEIELRGSPPTPTTEISRARSMQAGATASPATGAMQWLRGAFKRGRVKANAE